MGVEMWAGRRAEGRKDGRECAVTDDRVLFGTSIWRKPGEWK